MFSDNFIFKILCVLKKISSCSLGLDVGTDTLSNRSLPDEGGEAED